MPNYTTQQKTSAKSVRRVLKLVIALAVSPRTYRELGALIDIDHDGLCRYIRLLNDLGFAVVSEYNGPDESTHRIDLSKSDLSEWLPLVGLIGRKHAPVPIIKPPKKVDQYWDLIKNDVASMSLSELSKRYDLSYSKLDRVLKQKGIKPPTQAESRIIAIKQLQSTGLTMIEISKKLNVSSALISHYNVKFKLGFPDCRFGPRKPNDKQPRRKPVEVTNLGRQPVADRAETLSRLKASGMSTKDMAHTTGLSIGTVYEYLSRAGLAGQGKRTKFGKKSKPIRVI